MTIVLILAGLAFLLIGGEALVRGSVAIGRHLGMSALAVGMVIVGFGTSMPELVVSVRAVLAGSPDLAAGNVIGSNISNILLILAAAALFRPITRPARLLLPDGAVLLAVSCGVLLLGLQDTIPPWQGAAMIAVLIAVVATEYARAQRERRLRELMKVPLPLPEDVPVRPSVAALLILAGIGGLLLGAEWLVDGATRLARHLGVSDGLIGLSIVAVGTSLPELASSIVASRRGHSDVAYGTIIGSSLFNLLGILGAAALAGPLAIPPMMVRVDGGVMIAATLAMLYFLWSGTGLSRLEAALLVSAYLLYMSFRYGAAMA